MSVRTRRRQPQRRDDGASAVEFALVAPVLFLILFGIIDYGIWFADSISARQAVRDGARRGVVEVFTSGSCTATGRPDLENLACGVKKGMEPIAGTTYVKISVTTAPGAPTSGANWAVGNTLRVCGMTQHTALMPLVPFPADGIARTKVEMPIEQATAGASRGTFQDTDPTGQNWSWCP
jgi:Flp pilus assembly protein TadG